MSSVSKITGDIRTVRGPNKLVLVAQLPEGTTQFTAVVKQGEWEISYVVPVPSEIEPLQLA